MKSGASTLRGRILPVVVVLGCQSLLLLTHLDLLPAWGDELFTLRAAALPIRAIISMVQNDIHPPLYYMLLHEWVRLPLPWSGLAALRAFSAAATLLATFLFDHFWLCRWKPVRRYIALALFAFSPCLILYGRMARSYAMQTAIALLTISLLWRWLRDPRGGLRCALPAFAATTVLLYTHYLPGLAVLAGFVLVAWRRLGFGRVAMFGAATAVAYAPWAMTLTMALQNWQRAEAFQSHYALSGNLITEQGLKIAFMLVSLTVGETFFPLSLALVPVVLALAWRGYRLRAGGPSLAAFVSIAALVGYVGATRWVTWPFMAARLLWLLPFLTLALAVGVSRSRPLVRYVAVAVILVSFASSAVLYFRRDNFVNLCYAAPLREIASRLRSEASPADVVLIDGYNADAEVIRFYLGYAVPSFAIQAETAAREEALAAPVPAVWVVRNTRDVSPGHVVSVVEASVCSGRSRSDVFYQRYAAWQRTALGMLGSAAAPEYFYEVTVCRKLSPPEQ
jgi:uncharacterized membrane protein